MGLSNEERAQLATILGCNVEQLDDKLKPYLDAASEEYQRMFLGQRVFTRGADIREYRLYLVIVHVFGGRLPSEEHISALFQTTSTQSRSLLRAVMSKYQYDLHEGIRETLRDLVSSAKKDELTNSWTIVAESENLVEALNREIRQIDGGLPQVAKVRGTASAYEIENSTRGKLVERLQ